ncbi:MAG: HEAT repeat domain-containing protein [Actinomycetota bacterium]
MSDREWWSRRAPSGKPPVEPTAEPTTRGPLADLRHPNANKRLAAVESCGTAVAGDTAEALIDMVAKDTSAKVRAAAVRALSDSPAEVRLRGAGAALSSDDPAVRVEGVGLLVGTTDEDALLLARALNDPDQNVAFKAVEGLGGHAALEAFGLLWASLPSAAPDVQARIVDELRRIDGRVLVLLGRRALDSVDPEERVLGAYVLSRGNDRPADHLIGSLDDPSPEVRVGTLQALLAHPGPIDVDAIGERLRDPETKVRSMAVALLAKIEDNRSLPYLLDGIRDPSNEVREAARQALLSRSPESVVELLLRALKYPSHRRVAADLLVDMGDLAIDSLLASLPDVPPELRGMVGDILVQGHATHKLVTDLEDRDPKRRLLAVLGLGAMQAIEAVEALITRLNDPDAQVRAATVRVVADFGDPRAVQPLRRAFVHDPDMEVVGLIEQALREITGEAPEEPREH